MNTPATSTEYKVDPDAQASAARILRAIDAGQNGKLAASVDAIIIPDGVPLSKWDDGSIRISGTRVHLYILLGPHVDGKPAEEIATMYDSVTLEKIHLITYYYEKNKALIDDYLFETDKEGDRVMKIVVADPFHQESHARLIQRMKKYKERVAETNNAEGEHAQIPG